MTPNPSPAVCPSQSPVLSPNAIPALYVTVPASALTGFASLLQHGILFPVVQPMAVVPFLLALPGFSASYIEQTVQTIFIDGVAADSLDRELGGGSTLALSAAMPGLAGAIFRRQGVHGTLRSRPEGRTAEGQSSGYITLKLFNSIAADRVRDLLPQGILVTGRALQGFATMRESLFQPPSMTSLDGRAVDYAELLAVAGTHPVVAVQAVSFPA